MVQKLIREQYVTEVTLAFGNRGRCVPVETDAHLLRHRLCAHARLSVAVAGVEGQTHNLELLTTLARSTQCVELVNLVHLGVEEMTVSLRHSQHEGWVGHIGVHLLYDQSLGTLALVLVGTLRVHLLFPLPFTLQVLCVTLADIRHDVVDGLRDTVLTRLRISAMM